MTQLQRIIFVFFFFNDTATTEIYTLSLHDALPISHQLVRAHRFLQVFGDLVLQYQDRKSTRLNSSHGSISYAVFCLKTTKIRSPLSSSPTSHASTARASITRGTGARAPRWTETAQ